MLDSSALLGQALPLRYCHTQRQNSGLPVGEDAPGGLLEAGAAYYGASAQNERLVLDAPSAPKVACTVEPFSALFLSLALATLRKMVIQSSSEASGIGLHSCFIRQAQRCSGNEVTWHQLHRFGPGGPAVHGSGRVRLPVVDDKADLEMQPQRRQLPHRVVLWLGPEYYRVAVSRLADCAFDQERGGAQHACHASIMLCSSMLGQPRHWQ